MYFSSHALDEDVFNYVVERKPPDPICFGSKAPRDTTPIGKALSPFQKKEAPEVNPKVGPGYYDSEKYKTSMDKVFNKVRSVKGVGPLASSDPRFKNKIFMRTPSPTKYDVAPSLVQRYQALAPFGSKVERKTMTFNKLPGPGTYPVPRKKCRRTRFMYNLGRPEMIPATEIICIPKPKDTCVKCEQLCCGDYWHKDHVIFLCHLCWEEEKRGKEIYGEKELKSFKKMRNCTFAHSHEGTTAAIRLQPNEKIKKKLRLENYLDLYIKC